VDLADLVRAAGRPRSELMARRTVGHFVVIGALLFALTRWLGASGDADPLALRAAFDAAVTDGPRRSDSLAPINTEGTDDAPDEQTLYRAAVASGLDRDDPVVQRRLVGGMQLLNGGATDDGELYSDAARLGLGASDVVIRRRLVERMRMRLQDAALAAEPSEAELQEYLAGHRQRFRIPARVRLTQVFVSRQRHGEAIDVDARRLRDRLTTADVARADELGDPLPYPVHVPPASEQDLARLFGAEFAATALRLEPGRWQGPLASPYGLHVVWVHERTPEIDPPLDAVRTAVRAALREERAGAALRTGVAALRAASAGDGTPSGG